MDDVKKLIISLITSSNNLVEILGSNDCNDEVSEEARKRLLIQLHVFVRGIRDNLNDLDEQLWLMISGLLKITSGNLPKTIMQHSGSSLRKNTAANNKTVSNTVYDCDHLQDCSLSPASHPPPSKSNKNSENLFRRDHLTGESTKQTQEVRLIEKLSFDEKLRRRYEGYPYPENVTVVSPSDIFEQLKVFSLRFPEKIPEIEPRTHTEQTTQISTVEDTEDCTQAVNDNFPQTISSTSPLVSSFNASFSQPSRLSFGPLRRTPRSSNPPDRLKAAEERQRTLLAKPSLLAKPRNRDFKNKENSDLENIKSKIKMERPTRNINKTICKTPTKKNSQGKDKNKRKKKSPSSSDFEDETLSLEQIRKKKGSTQ